jgi:hypothetical protein
MRTVQNYLSYARPKTALHVLVHSVLAAAVSAGNEHMVRHLLVVKFESILGIAQKEFKKETSTQEGFQDTYRR